MNETYVTVEIELHGGRCTMRALNNGVELAEVQGASVHEAVPALISKFKDLQEAAIEALYASGLVRRASLEDEDDADVEMPS